MWSRTITPPPLDTPVLMAVQDDEGVWHMEVTTRWSDRLGHVGGDYWERFTHWKVLPPPPSTR